MLYIEYTQKEGKKNIREKQKSDSIFMPSRLLIKLNAVDFLTSSYKMSHSNILFDQGYDLIPYLTFD